MYNDEASIETQLTARICHDLISPIGAIQNGLELMELSGDTQTEEFQLVKQSTLNANSTLAFLRQAFRTDTDLSEISEDKIRTLLDRRYEFKRIEIDWAIEGPQTQSDVTLAFLLALCFESAMPNGGKIVFRKSTPSWAIEATADKFKFDADPWESLGSLEQRSTSASLVHFELAKHHLTNVSATQNWIAIEGGHKYIYTPNRS